MIDIDINLCKFLKPKIASNLQHQPFTYDKYILHNLDREYSLNEMGVS